MNQEGGAAVNVAAQQAQAFVGRIPRLHDNVVQFVAQEVVDHVLIAAFDFKEIGEHADGSAAALQPTRSEELADRLGGIAVLGDDAFERTLLTHEGGVLAAQRVEVALGIGFGRRAWPRVAGASR